MTHDPDATAVLVVVQTEVEATLIADALRDCGITVETSGGLTSGYRAEAPGAAKVIVRQADLPAARQALDEYRQACRDIDWSTVDFGPEGAVP